MKSCIICKEIKPLTEYYNHSEMKDGKLGKCKVCTKLHTKKYIQENKEYKLTYDKQYHQQNKEKIKEQHKEHYQQNKQQYKEHYQQNKEKLNIRNNQYQKNRKKIDPIFKLSSNTRKLILISFKKQCNGVYKKNKKTEDILGCTLKEFITYLQSQFQPGMTLENHGQGTGKWNIDHIIPISSAKTEEEILTLSYYTNFQPLWWEENMKKFNH
jgi:hypothetical protein